MTEFNNSDQTDSDDDRDGNDKFKKRELKESSRPFPAMMYNVDGSNISPSEIVNIAPGEGQIPVSFTLEPNQEATEFPKTCSAGRNNLIEERQIPITPSKFVHVRLKCFDDRFAANPQYIFHALVASSAHFAQKERISEWNQLSM